jgi:hypothetical protein
VGKNVAFALVALLAGLVGGTLATWTGGSTETRPRVPAPPPHVVAVESSGDAASLRAELARVESRLASAEAELAESKRQIVNFQVFVSKLEGGSAPSGESAPAPVKAARVAATPSGQAPPAFRPGDTISAVYDAAGKPDEETAAAREGKRVLSYYKAGFSVTLDAQGRVVSTTIYGEPASDVRDQNGNYQLFDEKGRVYRPQAWQVQGVSVGTPLFDVVAKLGKPDTASLDTNGHYALHYKALDLVVFCDIGPEYRVLNFRMGGGAPQPDIYGGLH